MSLMLLTNLVTVEAHAQFTLSGQLRTRTEVRNGLGNLVLKDSKAAAFTSQRTRLVFGYKWERLTFGVSVQDVRVWGQDASSVSSADGNRFMLHEAWADLMLFDPLVSRDGESHWPDAEPGTKMRVAGHDGTVLIVEHLH